ncbi:SRPBCC family protein [Paenibacillus chartarius]|uniref:SRPBCC family protein n=1 Tax=Paenibacillus chartarius TaxID=747481 RepID=A0ABV6DMZ4_9BACL
MMQGPAMNNTFTHVEGRVLTVQRSFPAPRELVYEAWTDPKHLPHWWGPEGFTLTVQDIDVRPGGVWRYVMHGPDGTDYDNIIRYIDVDPPQLLLYTHGDPEVEERFRVTVTFDDIDDNTELTMRMQFISALELETAVRQYGAIEGASSTLGRLAIILERMQGGVRA